MAAPPPEPRPRLFHLTEPAALQRLCSGEAHAPASLAGEGFVHLSRAAQLAGTLERHYASARQLVLLELDRARAEPALRWERSRGGDSFPHLYRGLERADLVRGWELKRPAGERWPTPLLPRDPRGDRPAATRYFAAGAAPGAAGGATEGAP
ncbi:MAG: DUF952 domain-containing protein [Planctomycetes bacterium]|nr:DUF952 domain-containing protein [Planctomycetota bacterium]